MKMQTQQQMRAGKQSGFTLIELMIVVTIIGVLASIAVPVYRDYTIRTRVSETASIFSPIKAEIALFFSENGTLPRALSDMPRVAQTPASYAGEYVATLDIRPTGPLLIDVEIMLKNDPRLGPDWTNGGASGGQVIFTPIVVPGGATIRWDVFGGPSSLFPDKYLPTQ